MPAQPRHLEWLRKIDPKNPPHDFGVRLYEMISDLAKNDTMMAQQGNLSLTGNPTAPPTPQGLTVVPHPQGVQFSIQHEGEFYQGLKYEIDVTSGGATHSYDVGSSRNGILPVGPITANYQVRAMYPSGTSSPPVPLKGPVSGGSGSATLLPGQGSGTTRAGQPPGFGGPYRGDKPPARTP
jgi:hypothetical protein